MSALGIKAKRIEEISGINGYLIRMIHLPNHLKTMSNKNYND